MILFEEDFVREGAIPHWQTKNKSAIKISILLKQMGIKNNLFMLALYDTSLATIDPHDPNLTPEQKIRIAYECKINPWYAIREVVRVPKQGAGAVPFEFNRANLATIWTFLNNIDLFLTMPRQIGKTITIICIVAWLMYIGGHHLNIGLFAKDASLMRENVARLKIIRDALPTYLISHSVADTNNKEGIAYKALETKYLTFVAQKDKRAAEDQGRGETIAIEHWDEMGYYDNNDLSYPSALAASDTAVEQVRSTGVPAANMITTTAGRLADKRGRYAYKIKEQALPFSEHIYDLPNIEAVHDILDVNSANQMLYLEFSHTQLGKDETWLKRVTRGKDPATIACDYLNRWQLTAGESVIPKVIADKLLDNVHDPVTCTFYKSLVVRWYVDPEQLKSSGEYNKPFIIGNDTADNVDRDFTTMVIIDPANMQVICTCRCNTTNLMYVANCIFEFMLEFPRSIYIPERNKAGVALLDSLIVSLQGKGIDPFKRIFNTYIQDYNQNTPNLNTLDIANGAVRKHFGFTTTGSSRDFIFSSVLMNVVKTNATRMNDATLVEEIVSLTKRNGRIDHAAAGHDDMLIAYLLCCYFVMYGKNLSMYGIRKDEFLTTVDDSGESMTMEEKHARRKVRERIKFLTDRLETTSNVLVRDAYQAELRNLKSLYKDEDEQSEIVSMHQVENVAKEQVEHKSVTLSSFSPDVLAQFY